MPELSEFQRGINHCAERGRRAKAIREKIHRAYAEYISSGKVADETYPILVERFGDEFQSVSGRELTVKVIENTVSRPMGAVGESLTTAILVGKLWKLADACDEQVAEIDEELDNTDGQSGFVETEEEESVGGKFAGVKTKKIPMLEYRLRLMDRKVRAASAFLESVKALLPRDKVNILVQGGDVSVLADEEMDRQLEVIRGRRDVS